MNPNYFKEEILEEKCTVGRAFYRPVLKKMNDNEEPLFVYDDDDAVEIIMDKISDELKNKLSKEDIGFVLDLKFEYLESINTVAHTRAMSACKQE